MRPGIAVALMLVALFAGGHSVASGVTLSDQDKICLGCHGTAGLEKKLADGGTLSLHIDGSAFAGSVHSAVGCAACHADVDLRTHPARAPKIKSAREYTVARVEACKSCHEDKFKLYETSIHATLLREGNPIAPVCADCHSPHAIRAKAARASLEDIPCRKCHGEIFEAYAQSVHGQARRKSPDSIAPICSDCHHAHEVAAASTSGQPTGACLTCHQDALGAHQVWLPNAATHLQVISCPVCHAPTAKRRVDLRLIDRASGKRVAESEGVPQFEARARSADAKGLGLDALALQSLLKEFSREGGEGKVILRGRLEVSNGPDGHRLTAKSGAIRACATCHRQGSDVFQSVTVSIVGADGRPVRYGAQKDILNSVASVDSVGGFYAIGATRIKLLDWLLVLALAGGIGIPIGHQTLRWVFGRYAQKIRDQEAARRAERGTEPSRDPPAGGTPG